MRWRKDCGTGASRSRSQPDVHHHTTSGGERSQVRETRRRAHTHRLQRRDQFGALQSQERFRWGLGPRVEDVHTLQVERCTGKVGEVNFVHEMLPASAYEPSRGDWHAGDERCAEGPGLRGARRVCWLRRCGGRCGVDFAQAQWLNRALRPRSDEFLARRVDLALVLAADLIHGKGDCTVADLDVSRAKTPRYPDRRS